MEFWQTHPTESDLHFAQIINSIKPVETTQDLQLEANSPAAPTKYSLLEANSPTAPAKYVEDLASDYAMIPQMKKFKTENSLSSIPSRYGDFLQRLRKIADKLPSRQENSKNSRLPELLKFVMAELELKLAMNEFKSQSSELDFWASIQDMARNCGIDCGEFEKLCCPLVLQDVACAGIPRLVDEVHDAPLSGHVGCSLTGYFIDMVLDNAFPWYPLDTAKDIAYTTPSFQQLPFNKCQRQITISSPIKHPEQENLCTPGSPYSAFSTSLTPPLQRSCTSTISISDGAASEQRNDPCLLVYLNAGNPRPQLLATVPKACRRRIQRQRKRATNYNHLSSNFGASTSSLTYNANAVSVSDLQFLLEKELKPSDVGSLGRIILPKRQAEEKLPHLEAKEGVKLSFQDLQTSQIWDLRFRFWPNNKTRMYLLESTGSFVKSHRLQEGDFVVLYRNPATGMYMINCKKATWSKLRERRSLPPSREATVGSSGDKLSFGPGVTTSMVKNPENKNDSVSGMQQLPTSLGSNEIKTSSTNEDTDLLRWDIEDPDELMKGFSEIGAGSIDELFGLKE